MPVGFIDFITLSKYKDLIDNYTILPIEQYEKICAVSNKYLLYKIADSINVRYPATLRIEKQKNFSKIQSFIRKIGFPLVVKGIGDASKPYFLSNYEDLLTKLNCQVEQDLILQRFIPGIGVGYFVFSYMGKPIVEFMHKRIFETTPLGGASIKASSNFDPELMVLGRRIIRYLKWTGVMMAEFKKEIESGEYYLMEINPKFWGSLELAYRAGVDFPKYVADFFLKNEKPRQNFVKDISFSWIITTLSSYFKYGPKIMFEALMKSIPSSPLLSDLHVHDPPNFILKIAGCIFLILKSCIHNNIYLEDIYLSKPLKKLLYSIDITIFDLDGTLVKLKVPWNKVRQKALNKGLIKYGKSINECLYRYWKLNDKNAFKNLSVFLEKYEIKALKHIKENKDLKNALYNLKKRSIKIGIVSKQSRRVILECLRKLGIFNYIDIFIGREDSPIRFEQLQIAINKLGGSIGIFFGDTLVDVKAALKAGLIPCRVSTNDIKKLQSKMLNISYTSRVAEMLNIITHFLKNRIKTNPL